MITDKLKSYEAARRNMRLSIRHLSHKSLNNRAENSHLPLRKRERIMKNFRSLGGCKRFLSVFSAVRNLFVPPASVTTALSRHIHRVRVLSPNGITRPLSEAEDLFHGRRLPHGS